MTPNNINIKIIRSKRKTVSLEIKKDLQVIVRAPNRLPESEIMRFIEHKRDWLEKHLTIMQERKENAKSSPKFTENEISQLTEKTKIIIPEKVAFFAPIVGVQAGKITIRHQKTLWGSCSGKGNLNFNCLLTLTPPDVINYVVVHELCHLKQLNHSKKFWAEVARVLPNYKEPKSWLKKNGQELIQRLR